MDNSNDSAVVESRLERVTPDEVLSLLQRERVVLLVKEWPDYKKYGVLSTIGSGGKIVEYLVSVRKSLSEKQRHVTLAHELFHVLLAIEGLDDLDKEQEYSEEVIDHAAASFVEKNPLFIHNLWCHLVMAGWKGLS